MKVVKILFGLITWCLRVCTRSLPQLGVTRFACIHNFILFKMLKQPCAITLATCERKRTINIMMTAMTDDSDDRQEPSQRW